jgi:hypothetical protein
MMLGLAWNTVMEDVAEIGDALLAFELGRRAIAVCEGSDVDADAEEPVSSSPPHCARAFCMTFVLSSLNIRES